jgi:hypothetical protein
MLLLFKVLTLVKLKKNLQTHHLHTCRKLTKERKNEENFYEIDLEKKNMDSF